MYGRQTAAGDLFAGSGRALRLDPFSLPVRYAVPTAGQRPGAAAAVYLDRGQVILTRTGPAGPVTVSLPLSVYRGVAVRMDAPPTGDRVAVVLEINHSNPLLSLPLAFADDPMDVAADWQAWSRSLGLPMLLIEANGTVSEPLARMGALRRDETKPRRRHSYFADRRPRFLTRRKPGAAGSRGVIRAEEIIARE